MAPYQDLFSELLLSGLLEINFVRCS